MAGYTDLHQTAVVNILNCDPNETQHAEAVLIQRFHTFRGQIILL